LVRLGTDGDAVINFADSLVRLKNFKELFLCRNKLGEAGAKYFADALCDHPTLT
jgi:hypothetical protein